MDRITKKGVTWPPYTIPDQGLSAQRMIARAIEAGIKIALVDGQGRVFDLTS
jgi:hypothetical protein